MNYIDYIISPKPIYQTTTITIKNPETFITFIQNHFPSEQLFHHQLIFWILQNSTLYSIINNQIYLTMFNHRNINLFTKYNNTINKAFYIDFISHNKNILHHYQPQFDNNMYIMPYKLDNTYKFTEINYYNCPLNNWHIVNTRYKFNRMSYKDINYWLWFYNSFGSSQKDIFQILNIDEFSKIFTNIDNYILTLVCDKHTLCLISFNQYYLNDRKITIPEVLCFLSNHKRPDWILRMLFQYLYINNNRNVIFTNMLLKPKNLRKLMNALEIKKMMTVNMFSNVKMNTINANKVLLPIH